MIKSVLRWVLPLIVASGVAIGVAHAQTGVSSSTTAWPAACSIKSTQASRNVCFDQHLNALDARQRKSSAHELADRATIATLVARNSDLASCLGEFPVTKRDMYDNWYYGSDTNNDGNFDTNNYGGQFTPGMLEQTQSGWNVDDWFVRDMCTPGVFNRPLAP